MMRGSAIAANEVVRLMAAALCAVVAGGGVGLLMADRSAQDKLHARATRVNVTASSNAVSSSTPAIGAMIPEGGTPSAGATGLPVEVWREGVPTDKIWEVSIGADAAATGMGVAPVELWRIGGVFDSGAGPELIVVSGIAGPPRYLRAGERLPNGAVIVAITRDTVTVRTRINKRSVLVTLNV